ncbi:hypothetical protein LMG26686_00978 [Achromobacter mucicolens]|uniref:c-type cytochrome n=1 Tax=Achromobacter mucicolens TaxID=1389922 RepID=UPI0014684CB8|nr:c-type cytochrome [Achromobacter mucicolens]CAB3831869.1 hypothetical protein LMG26686_00978 [Achromobacter mucicolens]
MSMQNSGRPEMSVRKRIVYAGVLGLVLFGVGYAVYQSGGIGHVYESLGGKVETKVLSSAYDRSDMDHDRKAYKADRGADLPKMPVDVNGYYAPPPENSIPANPYGDAVRRGRAIFTETGTHVKDHVGNAMACVNCHLDAGRRENSAPMWGAYGAYPAYRSKTKSISTLEDRIMGCFTYSMNAQGSPSGKPPEAGSDVYRDLITYMAWMSDGAAAGQKLPGALYPKVSKPEEGYDLKRGLAVYQQNCALCHGGDGQGTSDPKGKMRFPPLWGPESYNWGAGMARINTAAGFIKANMPYGKPFSLTDQEAWDVAAFINSHERPKDPRQTGTVPEAAKAFHGGDSFYGKTLDGHLVGSGAELNRE